MDLKEQLLLLEPERVDTPPRALLTDRELSAQLQISRTTIWRLRTTGLPYVTVGRSVRYRLGEVQEWLATRHPGSVAEPTGFAYGGQESLSLPPCHWSRAVALDPKHRPQEPHKPSSTARREWWRFPQEAHLLDLAGNRYRRLQAQEIGAIQGFPAGWATPAGLPELELIRGYGNALPPALAEAVFTGLREIADSPLASGIEICAGFGGMALGAVRALGFEHRALIESWEPAVRVLRHVNEWPASAVVHGDLLDFPWEDFADRVDVLSGGPPCQPWSRAGKGLGSEDSRDLLGDMPGVVTRLRPAAFVFENVPGLLSGENEGYATWLIRQLRSPGAGLCYGVVAAVLNAADFGVPQVRRRVFIVGLRNTSDRRLHELFDLVANQRSHADPRRVLPAGRAPWRTIADAIPTWDRVSAGWRRWLGAGEESKNVPTRKDEEQQFDSGLPARPNYARIQLTWPHRDCFPVWSNDGWQIEQNESGDLATRPFLVEQAGDPLRDPSMLVGDPIANLVVSQRTYGRKTQLVYIDSPRIETNAANFEAADSDARLDTWLTVMQSIILRAMRLVSDDGAIVVLCGVIELPYVQMLLNEVAGPNNYIGTVVWQKGYSPRNMPGMKELSPTHDNLVIFAKRKSQLSSVALQVRPDKYSNPDDDPRGAWTAEQKGANKPDCDYDVNVPPYRWRIVSGELPPGLWRLNPKSGVIWGRGMDIQVAGEWAFTVEVRDQVGKVAQKKFSISVSPEAEAPAPAPPAWLIADRSKKGKPISADYGDGPLEIKTKRLPSARVGADYSACLEAQGGEPWLGTTRPGKTTPGGDARYWEFPAKTLLESAARDDVDFKSKDDAIPVIKTHLPPGKDRVTLNQMTTWLGKGRGKVKGVEDPFAAGFSEKAKEELQALVSAGHITNIVKTSKPTALVARLVALFTKPNGIVFDIGSPAAEMSTMATALGRRAVYVEFPSNEGVRHSITAPRLRLAARGLHPLPPGILGAPRVSESVPSGAEAAGYFVDGIPQRPRPEGNLTVLRLGRPAGLLDRTMSTLNIDYQAYPVADTQFLGMLASIEGMIPVREPKPSFFAVDLNASLRACYIESSGFLDFRTAERLADEHRDFLNAGGRLRIYYHRGQEVAGDQAECLEFRRIPYDLQLASGVL